MLLAILPQFGNNSETERNIWAALLRLPEENQLNAFLSDGNLEVAYLVTDFACPEKEFRFTQKAQTNR